VTQPDARLWLCIDYRNIKSSTITNSYPLPLIKYTVNLVHKATIYMKLDVRGGSNLLRVKNGYEYMLGFLTRYRLFEPTVLKFRATNAHADIPSCINHAIREAINDFASAYLNDVLIYSDSEEEHIEHVKWIMQHLFKAG